MWCLAMQRRRQQNNTKGSLTPAPRAPMGSPPAADTRPGVRQQTRAVRGAGAALPRCPSPRSADLKRAPSNFSKSGRDGRRGAAASTRTMVLCTGTRGSRVRSPPLCTILRFSERRTRANFPPKKILTIWPTGEGTTCDWYKGPQSCSQAHCGPGETFTFRPCTAEKKLFRASLGLQFFETA
jgi:hypothetical protein